PALPKEIRQLIARMVKRIGRCNSYAKRFLVAMVNQFLIHDRDSIFSSDLDEEVQRSFGLRVLRTPVRAPQANAYCERLIGTLRRECLDFMIPLNERHLRTTLRSWVAHYNKGRPHSSLGPAIPETSVARPLSYPQLHRYRVPPDCQIRAQDILYGLHHEYLMGKLCRMMAAEAFAEHRDSRPPSGRSARESLLSHGFCRPAYACGRGAANRAESRHGASAPRYRAKLQPTAFS